MSERLFRPDWPLPRGVHAFVTLRGGGRSSGAWSSFNLAQHAGDAACDVNANRALLLDDLRAETGLAVSAVQWLNQVHGTRVFHAGNAALPAPEADAAYARGSRLALGVMTADCLPVLFCSSDGREIAVAHAGWRGLLGGVLEATLGSFHARPAAITAWLGPAIGPCHFEVGPEVRAAFLADAAAALADAGTALADAAAAQYAGTEAAFAPGARPGKWLADLYALARLRLRKCGVTNLHGTPLCTVCNHERFYSYRKQALTGRFATLILQTP